MAGSDAVVDVNSTGSTPIATRSQTQGGGTVYVQQSVIVDKDGSGTAAIGAAVDANGLHVVQTFGTGKNSSALTNGAIAAGGSATITSDVAVTNAKTASVQHVIMSAEFAARWDFQTVNNSGTASTRFSVLTAAMQSFDYTAVTSTEIQGVLSTGPATMQVVCTNRDTQAGAAFVQFFWAEN